MRASVRSDQPDVDGDLVRGGEFVQSLERGLSVIRAFGAERPALTLSEVARVTGLSRAAARRFLHTLVELGYMGTDGRQFHLRPRVLELGYAYLSSLGLSEVAQPHLEALSLEVGESSSVAVLDQSDIVYVARFATHRIMTTTIRVGTRFPAHVTSLGRAMLAFGDVAETDAILAEVDWTPLTPHTITDPDELRAELATVRAQGWAFVDQELEEGLRSLAMPLRDGSGQVVAAVNVSVPVRRGSIDEVVGQLLPALKRAAREIEADLARIGGFPR